MAGEMIKMIIATNMQQFWQGIKQGWHSFSKNIVIIINSVLLSIVYIISVGITHIVAKLCKKHFLELKLEKNRQSYWQDLNLKKRSLEEYYRQF